MEFLATKLRGILYFRELESSHENILGGPLSLIASRVI